MGLFSALRRKQVRLASRLLLASQRLPGIKAVLCAAGRSHAVSRALVGHRRIYATRAEADAAIERAGLPGHDAPQAVATHIALGERARPSDYPVLYHLGTILPEVRRIVDIGGNAGNIFYCYSRYLTFPADMQWLVNDMPEPLAAGRSLAEERGEQRLRFEADLSNCGPADLVLFSGSLHYFEAMPPYLLSCWQSKPKYIVVNRSPMGGSPAVYGLQDAGAYMVSAKVLDRGELLRAMDDAGYDLMDEWPVYELSLRFPLHPQCSSEVYLGQFFCLRDAPASKPLI